MCLTDRMMKAVLLALLLAATTAAQAAPRIPVKVVVVAMFETGEDTGDAPGEYQLWVEREHLDHIIPLTNGYHHVRMNKDGVLGILTGMGTAKAAASVMALGSDPRFDLTKAYWVVAGIGGGDPADVSLASAVWADRILDGDLGYEIDGRDIPKDWTTGFVPLSKKVPYEQPVRQELQGELYTLNPKLVDWAYQLTKDFPIPDSEALQQSRARFTGFPNAQRAPFVTTGAAMSSSTFWHGARLDTWANEWTSYFTAGKANYMIAGMEDTGTMQSLTMLAAAGKADINRVLILRTVSNYDRESPGSTAAESLAAMSDRRYSAFRAAIETAQTVGDKVVRYLVTHWPEVKTTIP